MSTVGVEQLLNLMSEAFGGGAPDEDGSSLITHDSYHAGEINHLRSLLSGDDRWAHVRELDERPGP